MWEFPLKHRDSIIYYYQLSLLFVIIKNLSLDKRFISSTTCDVLQ